MVLVFDVDTLQNSDNELIDYFVNSKHAVRELKVRPNYVTFRDRFRNNNYATFLLNPNTGKYCS
jgi:hypothetical protein